jgi:hypothetical protein
MLWELRSDSSSSIRNSFSKRRECLYWGIGRRLLDFRVLDAVDVKIFLFTYNGCLQRTGFREMQKNLRSFALCRFGCCLRNIHSLAMAVFWGKFSLVQSLWWVLSYTRPVQTSDACLGSPTDIPGCCHRKPLNYGETFYSIDHRPTLRPDFETPGTRRCSARHLSSKSLLTSHYSDCDRPGIGAQNDH